MLTALVVIAALYVAYRIGRRVGQAQGLLAAALVAAETDNVDLDVSGRVADEREAEYVAAQREAASRQ